MDNKSQQTNNKIQVMTCNDKKRLADTNRKLKTIASIMPDEWAEGNNKVSLLKSIHTDILGFDKKGNPRSLNDLRYFMFQASQRNLNPFKKQIHAVYISDSQKGGEQLVPITGIDGFVKIAQKSGMYAGMSEARVEFENGLPIKASVDIFAYNPISGKREVVNTATAWYNEYVKLTDEYIDGKKTGKKVPNKTWRERPIGMLEKCAQALGIRRTFPDEVGGLYVKEELDHLQEQGLVRNDKIEDEVLKIEKAVAERRKNNDKTK